MKIAHINIIFSNKNMTGVINKLKGEAEAMKKYDIDMYVLNREIDGYIDNIYFIKVDKFLPKFFKEIYLRGFKYFIMDKAIDLKSYDVIILRYPLMDFSTIFFSRKYKDKLITEHHTKELEEIKKLKINFIFKNIQYFLEKFLAKYFFKNLKGIIGISKDVVESVKDRIKNSYIPTYVFSNGIKLQKQNIIEKKIDTIDILFVASYFQPWHGLDSFIKALKNYKGNDKIIFHVAGKLPDSIKNDLLTLNSPNINVIIHGILDKQSLEKLYEKINIACNSLAMYRINMKESSTLKSKEYILHYIPFLYSAPDPDLINLEKYLFKCDKERDINLESIINSYKTFNFIEMKKDFDYCINNVLNWDIKVYNLRKWIEGIVYDKLNKKH